MHMNGWVVFNGRNTPLVYVQTTQFYKSRCSSYNQILFY